MPSRSTTFPLRTRTPPGATAPMPNSGCPGAPSLRETKTSSGAPREREISYPTGTPPRGNPKTTHLPPRKRDSFAASFCPASLRSSNGGERKILTAVSADTPPERGEDLSALLDLPNPTRVLPIGRLILDPLNAGGHALGKGLQVVASFEYESRRRGTDLKGELRDQRGEAPESAAGERHAPEQIVRMGIESRGDEDQTRPELPEHGRE